MLSLFVPLEHSPLRSASFLACFASHVFAAEYAIGADVSFLAFAEQKGVVFKDDGQTKARAADFQRPRLQLGPPAPVPHARPTAQRLEYTIAQAKAAKKLGFKFLLDFHYSDTWADPQKQFIPTAWEGLEHDKLVDAVYSYTRDVVAALRDADAMPDMVQIGNEVIGGMLWPDGRLPQNWTNLRRSVEGRNSRREQRAPSGGHRPEIMIHIDRGGDQKSTRRFFDKCRELGVEYDVIGQSYYPWWHGSLSDLRKNLDFMARTYEKDIILVEVAYNWRPAEYKNGNAPFPETPEGQKQFLARGQRDRAQHARRPRSRHLLVGAGRAARFAGQPRHV